MKDKSNLKEAIIQATTDLIQECNGDVNKITLRKISERHIFRELNTKHRMGCIGQKSAVGNRYMTPKLRFLFIKSQSAIYFMKLEN